MLHHVGLRKGQSRGHQLGPDRQLPDSSQGTYLRWIWEELDKEYKPDRDLVLCTWGKPEALSLGHCENPVPALRLSLSLSVQVRTKGPLTISPSPDILGLWALLPSLR